MGGSSRTLKSGNSVHTSSIKIWNSQKCHGALMCHGKLAYSRAHSGVGVQTDHFCTKEQNSALKQAFSTQRVRPESDPCCNSKGCPEQGVPGTRHAVHTGYTHPHYVLSRAIVRFGPPAGLPLRNESKCKTVHGSEKVLRIPRIYSSQIDSCLQ